MTTHPTLAKSSPLAWLAPLRLRSLRSLVARIVAFDALARERAQLADLDDRMLRDVGLTRGDVERTLSRPDEHLWLILSRSPRQL